MGEMPQNCNALVRIDKHVHFCKHNCKWGFVSQGRPRTGEQRPASKVTKKKRIKNPKTICFTIEEEHYEFIKKQALMLSSQNGSIVQPNDIIREALQKAFPCPQLFDLFGTRKK